MATSAIQSVGVVVDAHVTGFQWTVKDIDALAKLIAVITLGQAEHAFEIIVTLAPTAPVPTEAELHSDARLQMQVRGDTAEKRTASRNQRDGYLFECISWIVARQSGGSRTYLKDPHLDPTMHGLDGLILDLEPTKPVITRATIVDARAPDVLPIAPEPPGSRPAHLRPAQPSILSTKDRRRRWR